jgi:hypothetical protein
VVILAIALAAVTLLLVANAYAVQRATNEDGRVQRLAANATISASDLLGDAYGAASIVSSKLGVDPTRVAVTQTAGTWCIAVRSEYWSRSQESSFELHAGKLFPAAHC